ncbi:MARCKS-related protein [Strigops habroptila]|uniref:MARCKS like 1 n=1 Tax=Strigops habroptila TaxID=2489341 RepID=A0A672UYI2_STRHB|nr:MARCKS-related protein [Strigops habroptila]
MGSQGSKAAKAGGSAPPAGHAAATEPAKANGQENGHLRVNGDTTARAGGEAAAPNGNGSSEPLEEEERRKKGESGSGDAIEPASPAEAGDAQPEGAAAAPRDTPKKKKKFSFKKSFKLSGISFRKNKKEAGDSAGSTPSEEQGQAGESPGSATDGTESPAASGEGAAAARGGPVAGTEPGGSGEEKQQQPEESPGAAAEPGEPSKPAGPEPIATAAEQEEE